MRSAVSGRRERQVPTYPDLACKVAALKGGSGGIGAATCRLPAAHGAIVAVNGRNETAIENLGAMRRITAALTDAGWVWITPPTFGEERAAAYPPFRMGRSHWRHADVLAVADFVGEQEDPVMDLQAVLGLPADPELQGPDGVRSSLAGQGAIAGAFVERLSE